MKEQTITFISGNPENYMGYEPPLPIVKTLPEWYKDMPRNVFAPSGEKLGPTVKSCVPFFDAMTSGYSMQTPCDIAFYEEDGIIKHRVLNEKYKDFVGERPPMSDFHNPEGYHKYHFHWHMSWGISVPEGYSFLLTHPLNRYELPFLTTSGIADGDKMDVPGLLPFFIRTGFSGIVKAGTPIAQIIPILREDWKSETKILSAQEIQNHYQTKAEIYRTPDGNGYRNKEWQRKSYR